MKTNVRKWGNSLALRIPGSFAKEIGLEKETPVEISLEEGKLVVTLLPDSDLSLESLLSHITVENLHDETDFGLAMGNEIW